MADNELQRLQELATHGDLSPGVRAQVQARIAALSGAAAAPDQQAMRPSPILGPLAPEPVGSGPVSTRIRDLPAQILAKAPASVSERLPTAYLPTKEKSAVPILFSEPPSGNADEEWKSTISRAENEGRAAYRVSREWPTNPRTTNIPDVLANAPMRFYTDVVQPVIFGADKSVTGGLVTKGGVKAIQKLTGMPESVNEDVRRMNEASPVSSGVGALAGAFMPGLSKGAGQIGQAATKSLAGGGLAKRLLGNTLSGGIAGGLASGAESGVGSALGEKRDVQMDTGLGAGLGAGLGLVFGGLGELGRNRQAALRDPEVSREAQDLALAEKAGVKTHWLSGVKPDVKTPEGAAFRQSLDEMKPEAKEGWGLDAIAADRARGPVGDELVGYQQEVLKKVGEQNQSIYGQGSMVSSEPLVRKNLELLRKATHPDGTELPGHSVSGLASEMPKMADIEVVHASSPEAHAADPDLSLPAGLAAKLGLVQRGQGRDGYVAIIKPKNMSAEQLDSVNQLYAQRAKLGQWSPADEGVKGLQAAGLQNRDRFGSAVKRAKEEQAKALNEMNNAVEAFGLPRATNVDPTQQGTKNSIYNAIRGYKAGNTKPNDDAIRSVAGRSQEATRALDQAAAVGAYQRLRGQATPNVAMGPNGTVRPWGLMGAAKLHMDPIMGVFSHMGERFPGIVPGAASEASRRAGKNRNGR